MTKKLDKMKHTPDTRELAHELLNTGKVVEGYTLIYLQQIRDLLVELLKEALKP